MSVSAYSYSPDEERILAENLLALTSEIYAGQHLSNPVTAGHLRFLHKRIFDKVRDHAGRTRTAESGSEFLTFGPNRSLRRTEVERALDRVDLVQRLGADADRALDR